MNPLSTIIPSVVEGNGGFERSYDIYSRLLQDRIIFLGEEVNAKSENIGARRLHTIMEKVLDEIAKECIKSHTIQVTALSTALGMPGGLAVLGSIPGDFAQYRLPP